MWPDVHAGTQNLKLSSAITYDYDYDYDLIQGRGKACIPNHIQINYNNNYCS